MAPMIQNDVNPKRRRLITVTALTCSRAPLVLLFVAAAVADMLWPITADNLGAHLALRWLAIALLAVSAVTDLFDGQLARRWGVTSLFGAVCDPLMDKVFFVAVFPTVTAMLFVAGEFALGAISLCFTVLHVLRDLWVVTLRSLAAGKADMKANFIGKLRTAISFPIGIAAYCHVAFPWWGWLPAPLIAALLAFGLALNLYSAYAYTRRFRFAISDALHSK